MVIARGDSSYLSSSDNGVGFGLGTQTKIEQVLVSWFSGKKEKATNLATDTFCTLTDGHGITAKKKHWP